MAKAQAASKPSKASSKPITSQLSEQYVVDSDDDSDTAPVTAIADRTRNVAPKTGPPMSTRLKREVSSDVSESEESDAGSEEESSEELSAESTRGASANAANGLKRKVESRDLGDKSSSETDSLESVTPEKKRPKSEHTKSQTLQERTDATTLTKTVEAIAASAFTPPAGFVPFARDAHSNRASDLSSTALEGKQIWHIVAPSNVSLSALTEFALADLVAQRPIFSAKGTDYILREAAVDSNTPQLFLADGKQDYRALPYPISKTFHLHQHITLPNLNARQVSTNTGSAAAADLARTAVTHLRPQPKGLRMRFKPVGFGSGDPGRIGSESDSDEDGRSNARPTLQFPRALGAHAISEETKQDEKPTHKTKKDKTKIKEKDRAPREHKISQGESNNTPKKTIPLNGTIDSEPAPSSQSRKGPVGSVVNTPVQKAVAPEIEMMDASQTTNGGSADAKREREEKRRRKEDKARRKEEKRLNKARQSSSQIVIDSD